MDTRYYGMREISRFFLLQALHDGYSVNEIHELTAIDKWFLHKLSYMIGLSRDMEGFTR